MPAMLPMRRPRSDDTACRARRPLRRLQLERQDLRAVDLRRDRVADVLARAVHHLRVAEVEQVVRRHVGEPRGVVAPFAAAASASTPACDPESPAAPRVLARWKSPARPPARGVMYARSLSAMRLLLLFLLPGRASCGSAPCIACLLLILHAALARALAPRQRPCSLRSLVDLPCCLNTCRRASLREQGQWKTGPCSSLVARKTPSCRCSVRYTCRCGENSSGFWLAACLRRVRRERRVLLEKIADGREHRRLRERLRARVGDLRDRAGIGARVRHLHEIGAVLLHAGALLVGEVDA
jgi:hypothetical protein